MSAAQSGVMTLPNKTKQQSWVGTLITGQSLSNCAVHENCINESMICLLSVWLNNKIV